MNPAAPALPSERDWHRLGVHLGDELHSGKQSRAFAAQFGHRSIVVKLTDSRHADAEGLTERMGIVEQLAAEAPDVVSPIRVRGGLVQLLGAWLVTVAPLIEGTSLDLSDPSDGVLMGSSLAALHRSLADTGPSDLGPVAALAAVGARADRTSWQLLHGDFNERNLIVQDGRLRILDFDDCGYGPVGYDVAQALYMVMFDAETNGMPDRYATFRPAFLEGYSLGGGAELGDESLDAMIALRVDALGSWLDDLSNAPIGIRTSPPEWLEALAGFVRRHRATRERE